MLDPLTEAAMEDPIGALSLRIGLAVAEQNLEALRSALADTYNLSEQGALVIERAQSLMLPQQKNWFTYAIKQIQAGADE